MTPQQMNIRIAELEEENRQLRDAIAPSDVEIFGYGPIPSRILCTLARLCGKPTPLRKLTVSVYGTGVDRVPKTISTHVHYIRFPRHERMRAFDIQGGPWRGYALNEADCALVLTAIGR